MKRLCTKARAAPPCLGRRAVAQWPSAGDGNWDFVPCRAAIWQGHAEHCGVGELHCHVTFIRRLLRQHTGH